MVYIEGHIIMRKGEKIGWFDGGQIYDSDGRHLGYFENEKVFDRLGNKLGFIQKDFFRLKSGGSIEVEKAVQEVGGGSISDLGRLAIFLFFDR